MIKKCYVLDGKIINIGEWESESLHPAGAIEEEREFEYTEERGWFEVGTVPQPSEIEILKMEQAKTNTEMINLMMSMLGGAM